MSEQERRSISEISASTRAHSESLENLQNDHSTKSSSIENKARETFEQRYMVSLAVSFI